MSRHKEFVGHSLAVAANAGSKLAEKLRVDERKRISMTTLVQALVNDPLRASIYLELCQENVGIERIRELVSHTMGLPAESLPSLLLRQIDLQNRDIVYTYELLYREWLIRNKFSVSVLSDKSSKYDWRTIGQAIMEQWRFPRLAIERHGIREDEGRFMNQFQRGHLIDDPLGNPIPKFLVVKNKQTVVGYGTFVVVDEELFREKSLSRITKDDLIQRANPKEGGVMVFLSATPVIPDMFSRTASAVMLAGADYAKAHGLSEVLLPAHSPWAVLRQRQGASYDEIFNGRDTEGFPTDKWRKQLGLLADPTGEGGRAVVNEEFMLVTGATAELRAIMTPAELTDSAKGWGQFVNSRGQVFLKNCRAPIEINGLGYKVKIPAGWMRLRKLAENPTIGKMAPILAT